ncbi:MAG: phage tail sheath family protein [Bacteroidetes bacterium]|nr:MAG: phage tail sheath family protein [Bacteroidota bacterium]
MAIKLATPGVYIEEKNAFPNSVVAGSTAVPAFIGYTAKTSRKGQSLLNKAVRITSFTEFVDTFGGQPATKFTISEATGEEIDVEIAGKNYQISPEVAARHLLYDSLRLFFANGGGLCYIVPVGSYADEINKKAFEAGLNALISETEPTLVVIPEAVMLDKENAFAVQQAALLHCGQKMKNRFAILDVYDGYKKRSYDEDDVITQFREGVGNNFLNFGAAYYPWAYTSIVQADEISLANFADLAGLQTLLEAEVDAIYADAKRSAEAKVEIKKLTDAGSNLDAVHQTLNTISPAYKSILGQIRMQLNILPASAGIAGVYAMVDGTRGVWKAPANVGFNSVTLPTVKITHDDQEDLNVTVTGKSVNAIRSFPGEGVLVWGARTLDGNSQDWRYVNVRRTMLYIEESVKNAAKAYVFEANTANTWTLMKSMISSFLTDLWNQGGLVGTTADQAFEVLVGIGSTMTPNDVLDGIMRITVKVAISRPAEFIVITFQQKMQES